MEELKKDEIIAVLTKKELSEWRKIASELIACDEVLGYLVQRKITATERKVDFVERLKASYLVGNNTDFTIGLNGEVRKR